MTGTLHENQYIFMIISHSVPSTMRNVSDRYCENQTTHFMLNNIFCKNRAFYEIMWKNIVEPDRPLMTTWHIVTVCFVPKATDTYTEYVILIVFSQQRWLHELVSALRYT